MKRIHAMAAMMAALAIAMLVLVRPASRLAAAPLPTPPLSANILETGSSLLYPLFQLWVPVYTKANRGVKITPQSTGSGTGIAQATAGLVQIGASDAYMSDALVRQHPLLNIPLCISVQMVNYNLPGLNRVHLKVSGPVLAGIYQGKIRYWDDAAIKGLNPGVALPHHLIIPVHRTDGSGDTFIFTQYLSFSDPSGWGQSVSYGTTVSWPPVSGGLGAEGNPGMVTAIQDNPYSVAYIGTSFQNAIEKGGLGIALLKNRAGNFVFPSAKTADSAAAVMVSKTPQDERISLIFAPGAESYPIINYEYALVSRQQPSAQMAAALREFFNWAISERGGNAPHFMDAVHFVPLPAPIVKLSAAQIEEIQ